MRAAGLGSRSGLAAALRVTGALALSLLPITGSLTAAGDDELRELLVRYDDLYRSDRSSEARFTMRVKTKRFERQLTLQAWTEGSEKSLIRILAPAKERGVATLKVNQDIWNYLPKVDRTIKVPASMMSAGWMGSHLTNDDLVREARLSEDYACEISARPEREGSGHWLIACIPKPETPVTWGEVRLRMRAADELVEEVRFLGEDGALLRTITYGDFGELGGERLPRRVEVVPADEPDERTELIYEEVSFDVEVEDRLFTLQALRR